MGNHEPHHPGNRGYSIGKCDGRMKTYPLSETDVVEIVDFDQAEVGSPYIAMEYVADPDLLQALSHATQYRDSDRALYQRRT